MSSVSQTLPVPRTALSLTVRDYAELVKARVTTLIIITAWAGYFFGAAKASVPAFSWTLVHALLGIGMVSAGTAALNEFLERDLDALMRRTAQRPLVTRRMSAAHGLAVGAALVLGGSVYLALATNPLTALLTLLTSVVYLGVYTPLKRKTTLCTALGAFPGAMPPILGWAAARGTIEVEALALFAILYFWQFPHFHSIAWLYREDYERAGIRMLPVVDATGKATVRSVLLHLAALLPVTMAPFALHMSGFVYLVAAIALGIWFTLVGVRLAIKRMPPGDERSKPFARAVLKASVLYLPLLFAVMMLNGTR